MASKRGIQHLFPKMAAVLFILFSLTSYGVLPNTAKAASIDAAPLNLLSEEPVASGAIHKKYVLQFDRKGKEVKVRTNVVEVDLQNPNVKLDTMAGSNNQFTKKQTVREMAAETGAVAAVNGDFFNTKAEGVPIGPQIMNGKLLATPPYLSGFYSFALDKDNKPLIDLFTFKGNIMTKDFSSYPLGGVNKTYYWFEPDGTHSMIDGLFMYTNAWGQIDRSNDGVTVPTEVLVRNGKIEKIAPAGIIEMIAPTDGYILRASGKADEFVKAHMKVGEPLQALYEVLPLDSQKKYNTKQFRTMIGGGTILVDEGKPAEFSRQDANYTGYRSRTAIGYSRDQRYAYLVTVDRWEDSTGLSLPEMQQLLIKIGAWKGMNLDGGGSTQMAARPLGDVQPQLVNQPEIGGERKVVNGMGVYSIAPKGKLKDMIVRGETNLFINQQVAYQIKAYDEYFNPMETKDLATTWSMSNPIGMMIGNQFTPLKAGKTTLQVSAGPVQKNIDVSVIGKEQIEKMEISAANPLLMANSNYPLKVTAATQDGKTKQIPFEALKWEFVGFSGSVEAGTLRVKNMNAGIKQGLVIARYDGFSAVLAMPVGEKRTLADFDKTAFPVSFSGYPAEVAGTASVVAGYPGSQGKSLLLNYDFTQGSGTKAAYAVFGVSGNGAAVPGEPLYMNINVNGDNSLNWLRAEVVDGKGQQKRIDLTQRIDWTGWKTLSADLSPYEMSFPITLKKIYVANPEQGQDERALKGAIAIDDFSFTVKSIAEENRTTVKLTIDKKNLEVNGKPQSLDQAPVIVAGNTLVPVRFVVEAMGGTIGWDNAERKATVARGVHFAEMWIGQRNLIIDGQKITAEVAPTLMNERTMIPLRILAEHFGWKVSWEEQTRIVTLQ